MSAPDRSTDPLRCLSVLAAPEASVTPRVLGEFAKRGLLPSRFEAVVTGGGLAIDVHVDRLDDHAASHVAEVLRGMIHVERVLMTTKPLAQEVRA
jgi:hypothetical protein